MTAELGIFNGHLLQHLLAALWFLFCWVGYTRYATWKGRDTACLASVLHLYREDWMRRLLLRDNRIADASVIGNLERNASFFASSTLIILAGILTLLGSTDRAVSVLADLPFVEEASRGLSELKLLCLAVVFVYAFFTFSWCMRQYNFAAILVGSAPMIGERNVGELERKSFAERAARVISLAANQFNFGLRSYYFGRLREAPLNLPLPGDPRLRRITDALQADPADPRGISDWAGLVGASRRTLARLFREQTQLSFREWRQRLRLLNAVAALEEGASVTRVASDLGYDSTSAFISLFQRHFGQTPGCFARSLRLPN